MGGGSVKETDRGSNACPAGYQDFLYSELFGNADGVKRRGASKRNECAVGDVATLFDRVDTACTCHVLVHDFSDAE